MIRCTRDTWFELELAQQRFGASKRLDHQKRYGDRADKERLSIDLHMNMKDYKLRFILISKKACKGYFIKKIS